MLLVVVNIYDPDVTFKSIEQGYCRIIDDRGPPGPSGDDNSLLMYDIDHVSLPDNANSLVVAGLQRMGPSWMFVSLCKSGPVGPPEQHIGISTRSCSCLSRLLLPPLLCAFPRSSMCHCFQNRCGEQTV